MAITTQNKKDIFVIPDGCQDIIFVQKKNNKPYVFCSPLYNQTIKVELTSNTSMMGFRLRPGCSIQNINSTDLLSSFNSISELTDKIESFTHTNEHVSEALDCIRYYGKNIQFYAKELGVSPRTLQRLLSTQTSKPPSYWLRLARARQCAKDLINNNIHHEIAYQHHYADQAHMCRAIKHWFGITPTQLLERRDLIEQLFWAAY